MTYNIGKDEEIWERIYGTDERLHYLITSDKRRDLYFLYRVNKDKTVSKVGKAKNISQADWQRLHDAGIKEIWFKKGRFDDHIDKIAFEKGEL